MDVLLTHGFYLAEDPTERHVMRPYPPLGILYVSSYLKARGVDVAVFDSTFETPGDFDALMARSRPPIVGISANLLTRRWVLPMIGAARRQGASVVVGGPDPANYPAEYLSHGADVVVLGEGEATMADLVPALAGRAGAGPAEAGHHERHEAGHHEGHEAGHHEGRRRLESIPGIAFLNEEGGLVRTPARPFLSNLDDQPFPDRAAVDLTRYISTWRTHHGLGSVSLITARGCPYTCAWCSHSVFGYSHRRRSPANVADELELIVSSWKPDMVWYADDVFTINPRWLSAYATELQRRGLRVPFETISREDRLNEPVVRTLADMGCLRLWIGSESGSQRVMDAMERGTDVARVPHVVRLLQKHGIEAGLFVMLGYEGEEMADLEATVHHLTSCNADRVLTTIAYPIKGTPYFNRVEDRVFARSSWAAGSDRDLSVTGRRSPGFYHHATRWMLNEVAWRTEWQRPRPRYGKLARGFVNAQVGRLAMQLTQHAVDRARP
jgi:radical SAM superfamily enzyme YgiQ (UPF0313 family)